MYVGPRALPTGTLLCKPDDRISDSTQDMAASFRRIEPDYSDNQSVRNPTQPSPTSLTAELSFNCKARAPSLGLRVGV